MLGTVKGGLTNVNKDARASLSGANAARRADSAPYALMSLF